MLWLFLKSSNNSCLLLNMKDNLSESCSQNPYTVWVVTSLATASLLSSGKVFIQISKWTHFVNWTSSSCTSVAIELIDDLFMWHRHKWTLACFCMPSACSMQSIFDLVHALLCHWTVNLWMFFVWRRHNRNVYWLVLALYQSWTAHGYNMLLSNNNCWLRSCSHNYQCIYCWNILAITKWSVGFQPDCYINSILSFKDS